MTNIGSASISIQADVSDFSRTLRKAIEPLDQLAREASVNGEKISGSFTEAARESDSHLGKIGGADVWSPLKVESDKAGEHIESAMAEAERSSNKHLEGIHSTGTKVFGLLAGAAATIGVGRLFGGAISEASNLNESVNAVNVTFGDAAAGVQKLGTEAATSVGLSANEFNSLAVGFSSFVGKVAGPGGDVVDTLDDLTTRSADFASVMNLDVNEAAAVFQQALRGESEGMNRFGIDMSAGAVKAFALANGIGNAKGEMTEAELVQARYGLLMQSTEKNAGDFANTQDGLANSMRQLKAEAKDASAVFGTAFLPALQGVVGGVKDLIPDLQGPLQELGASIGESLGPLFEAIGPAISVVINVLGVVIGDVGTILGTLAPLISPIIQVVGVLATALSGGLAVAFTALAPSIELIGGFLDVFAEVLGEVLWGAIEAITPAIETIGTVLSETLAAILPTIIELFRDMAPSIAEIAGILGGVMAEALPPMADAFLAIWEALAPLVPILVDGLLFVLRELSPILPLVVEAFVAYKVIMMVVKPLQLAFNTLMAAFNLLMLENPAVLVAVAIAALAFGLYEAYKHCKTFRDIIDEIWQVLQKVWDVITTVGLVVFDALKVAVDGLVTAFEWLWQNALEPFVAFVMENFVPGVQLIVGVFQEIWSFISDNVIPILKEIVEVYIASLILAFDAVKVVIVDVLVPAFQAIWDFLTTYVIPIVKTFVEVHLWAIELAFNAIKTVIVDVLIPAFSAVWSFVRDNVIPIFEAIASTIGTVATTVGTAVGTIVGFITGIPDRIWQVAKTLWNGITDGISSARDWIRDRINDIVGFVTGIPGKFVTGLKTLVDVFTSPFKAAFNAIANLWNSTVGSLSFHVPSWVPGIGGAGFDVPDIPTFTAAGMIATFPQARIIGEAGAEAVIPITRPARAMQLMNESGLGAMWDRMHGSGPVVAIGNATFADATDADFVAQRVLASLTARMIAA